MQPVPKEHRTHTWHTKHNKYLNTDPRGVDRKSLQETCLLTNVCLSVNWVDFYMDTQSGLGTKHLPNPRVLLTKLEMLVMSQFECNEVNSYHGHFILALTHRCFQLSLMLKSSSSSVPLFCFRPIRIGLALLPSFSTTGSLVYETCLFLLVIPCVFLATGASEMPTGSQPSLASFVKTLGRVARILQPVIGDAHGSSRSLPLPSMPLPHGTGNTLPGFGILPAPQILISRAHRTASCLDPS